MAHKKDLLHAPDTPLILCCPQYSRYCPVRRALFTAMPQFGSVPAAPPWPSGAPARPGDTRRACRNPHSSPNQAPGEASTVRGCRHTLRKFIQQRQTKIKKPHLPGLQAFRPECPAWCGSILRTLMRVFSPAGNPAKGRAALLRRTSVLPQAKPRRRGNSLHSRWRRCRPTDVAYPLRVFAPSM